MKYTNAFIDYAQTIDDVYEYLKGYGPTKEKKLYIIFDDMITDMEPIRKS